MVGRVFMEFSGLLGRAGEEVLRPHTDKKSVAGQHAGASVIRLRLPVCRHRVQLGVSADPRALRAGGHEHCRRRVGRGTTLGASLTMDGGLIGTL
jgi:hypothetical protein